MDLPKARVFRGASLSEIAFPLGGIGTGTISLGGRGNLRDFEIFGGPAKGAVIPFTFFALWAKPEGRAPVARVLEGRIPPPYRNGFGEPQNQLQGLPRFADAWFEGRYPEATLHLEDGEVPVAVQLKAWNPFIPLNVHDSALPVAIFEWTLTNTSEVPVEVSLCGSMTNAMVATGGSGNHTQSGSVNRRDSSGALRGIFMHNPGAAPGDPRTGTMAMATTWPAGEEQTRWYRGGWWDKCHLFWADWCDDGRLSPVPDAEAAPDSGDTASVVARATLEPGQSVTVPFHIAWHFPLMANPWPGEGVKGPAPLPTYAGASFTDAWAVASYVEREGARLRRETQLWVEAMAGSSLPAPVLDAVTSQASTMRTATCFLLADGSFYGWEGCSDTAGCCHGNCTHVWNYEQALAFLFPQLERSMRRTEFIHNTSGTGRMHFRTQLPAGSSHWQMKPCADGQMGTIIQLYRDWQLSGDEEFLREMWPNAKAALEYAWTMKPDHPGREGIDSFWDLDRDGVMEGEQHNTYDIEFYGPNTMCTAMYLGALKASEAMAEHLGEQGKAAEYRAIREAGAAKVDATLFNGEYYVQHIEVIPEVTVPDHLKSPQSPKPVCDCKRSPGGKAQAIDASGVVPKYQYGEGCLSDQLLGQWASHVAGLGYVLDRDHVRDAIGSVFRNNFMHSLAGFANVQRVYGLNDEAGLLLCTWPHGNRPLLPFVYSDEVWTGIEYHVAAHLIYEGLVEEGLAVVEAVRERYAGSNRNPWNEVECGHHYARAMSSWSVKLALDGFSYSVPEGRLGFAPKLGGGTYRAFWSTGTGWGLFVQDAQAGTYRVEVLYGHLDLKRLDIAAIGARGAAAGSVTVTVVDGASAASPVEARLEASAVSFPVGVHLEAGRSLSIGIG